MQGIANKMLPNCVQNLNVKTERLTDLGYLSEATRLAEAPFHILTGVAHYHPEVTVGLVAVHSSVNCVVLNYRTMVV